MSADIYNFADMARKLRNPPNRVRELRKSYVWPDGRIGMSQEELGERIGMKMQLLSKRELGDIRLSSVEMERIASVLGVSPGDLFPRKANSDTLSAKERAVIDVMRNGPDHAAATIAAVAESLAQWREPAAEAEKKPAARRA